MEIIYLIVLAQHNGDGDALRKIFLGTELKVPYWKLPVITVDDTRKCR